MENVNIYEEFLRCQDFNYFASTYLKIRHPTRGHISLELYDFQKEVIKEYETNKNVILKKFRQGGFSTLTVLYALWKCMFHINQKFLFLCKTDRDAVCLGRIVDDAVKNLPSSFKPILTKNNDHNKVFSVTDSRMEFRMPEVCCAIAYTHLIIDEAAYIPNINQHWQTLRCGSLDTKCFILSTINGDNDWFARVYKNALIGDSKFKAIATNYKDHPDYSNPEWTERVRVNLGEATFAKEIEGKFPVSKRSAIQNILNNNMSDEELTKSIMRILLDK